LVLLSVPNVHVLLCEPAELRVTTPPSAQPALPFPATPGTPEPAYAVAILNQPLVEVAVVSIVLPGSATQRPAIVPVNAMLNLDTEDLTNLNVKY
jgi:hypothetical protein